MRMPDIDRITSDHYIYMAEEADTSPGQAAVCSALVLLSRAWQEFPRSLD